MVEHNPSVAQITLSEAFQGLNIEPFLWLDNTLHSREWVENEHSNNLRKLIMEIGPKLGWGREVPDSDVANFVAIGLGRDILRYPPIRSLLVRQRISNGFDSEMDALQRAAIILKLPTESTLEEIIVQTNSMIWRPSTKIALELCEFIGLPSRFARAGSTDERPPMFLAEPFTPLPQLLDFQSKVKDEIIQTIEESSRALVIMPTGSGKTRTSVESAITFLLENEERVGRILWLADRDELCEQAVQSFHQILVHRVTEPVPIWRYWTGNSVDFSIENGHRFVPGVVVTSTQQFRNRLSNGNPIAGHILASCRVIIIDEVHRNLDWNEKILKALSRENPDAAVIGLTATPLRRERHETERLAAMFNENAISPVEGGDSNPNLCRDVLIEKGILAKRIDATAADLNVQLSVTSSSSRRLGDAVEILKALSKHGSSSILVFAESVSHSRKLASILSLMGMPARHLDSGTPITERRSIISAFRNGQLKFLINYDILTTGFDAPNTDAVAILRTTDDCDQPLITQMVGRGLRGPRFGGTEECIVFIRGMR